MGNLDHVVRILIEEKDVIEAIIIAEGGAKYTNDPEDRGGGTKFGITQKRFPKLNIKTLTYDDAYRIYKREYWDRYKVKRLPAKFRHVYMDMLVNLGPGKAARILQRGANAIVKPHLKIDGGIGPKTIKALRLKKVDIGKIRAARIYMYCMIVSRKPEQIRFLEGWINRALEV